MQLGIGVGVFTSMVLLVARSAWPTYAVLGRLPKTNIYRDVERYPEAYAIPGVVIFRFDASLHFANKDYFASSFRAAISGGVQSHAKCGGVTAAVIEFGSVNDVDASALRMLQDVLKDLKEREVRLLLCNCNGPVLDVFERSGFTESITRESLCVSLSEAVKFGARLHAVRTGRADTAFLSAAPSPKPTERRGSAGSLSALSESPAALDLPESLAPASCLAAPATSNGKARDVSSGGADGKALAADSKALAADGSSSGGSSSGGSSSGGSSSGGSSSPGGRCGASEHAGNSSPSSLKSDEEVGTDVSTSPMYSRRSSIEGDSSSPLPSVAEKEEAVEVVVAAAEEAGLANGSAHGDSGGVRAFGGAVIIDGSERQVSLNSMVDDDA